MEDKFTVQKGKVQVDKREGVAYYLKEGSAFSVDVLSAAHGKPLPSSNVSHSGGSVRSTSDFLGCCFPQSSAAYSAPHGMSDPSSWEFNVALDATAESSKTDESCPFGLGVRGCPAGSLSIVIAREVIQCLVRGGYHWSLTHKEIDDQWLTRTKRVPTLILDGPVALSFMTINPLKSPL